MIILPSGRKIGEGQPVFIICEVGSNWQTLEDCLLSIRAAKACGADGVKFQLYSSRALYGYVPVEHFPSGVMDPTWLPRLKAESDRVGIEFMCSAFSVELLNEVDKYVNLHKLASSEMTHIRMLERLREIGKPVLMSTGASGEADIRHALAILMQKEYRKTYGDEGHYIISKEQLDVIPMYCVAAYPARVINTHMITVMARVFGTPVGYSDHSTDVLMIPWIAQQAGAVVIEKHVTFIEAETPDSPHSLNEREFRLMVARLRIASLPSKFTSPPEEQSMVLRHKRRLIATRDIEAGEPFKEGVNFGIYRSLKDDTKALHPFAIDQLIGKQAKNKIVAGDGIGPGDLCQTNKPI